MWHKVGIPEKCVLKNGMERPEKNLVDYTLLILERRDIWKRTLAIILMKSIKAIFMLKRIIWVASILV